MFPSSAIWAIDPIGLNNFVSEFNMLARNITFTAGEVEDLQRKVFLETKQDGHTMSINVNGPIIKGFSYAVYFGIAVDINELITALRAAESDNTIKNIYIRVNSPGGTIESIFELADTMRRVNAQKNITVQVDGQMASAALWFAVNAERIVATPSDMIGSIGVKTILMDTSKMFEEAGIRVIPIDTGAFKSMGEDGVPISEDQVKHLQGIVNKFFGDFKAAVQTGRKMTAEQVEAIADGRMFLAEDALHLGLIDAINTPHNTLSALRTVNQGDLHTRSAKSDFYRGLLENS